MTENQKVVSTIFVLIVASIVAYFAHLTSTEYMLLLIIGYLIVLVKCMPALEQSE